MILQIFRHTKIGVILTQFEELKTKMLLPAGRQFEQFLRITDLVPRTAH